MEETAGTVNSTLLTPKESSGDADQNAVSGKRWADGSPSALGCLGLLASNCECRQAVSRFSESPQNILCDSNFVHRKLNIFLLFITSDFFYWMITVNKCIRTN